MRKFLFLPLILMSSICFGATRNVVPRANDEGQIGTDSKKWHSVLATSGTISQLSINEIKWADGTIQVSSPSTGGGGSVDLSTINARLDNLDTSTQVITNRLDSLDSSTLTITDRLNLIDNSTQSINTRLNNLDVTTQTLTNQINELNISTQSIIEGNATVYININETNQVKSGYLTVSTMTVNKRFNVFDSTVVINRGRVGIGNFNPDNEILYSLGGIISTYESGGITYAIHTFTSSGTFTPYVTPFNVKVLIVGGGGGGGGGLYNGAGGGGGGVVYKSTYSVSGTIDVHIGVGGIGDTVSQGLNGEDSFFDVVIASGGGGGGCNTTWGTAGGSGGGGSPIDGIGGDGTLGQGYAGGNSFNTDDYGAGGGGGGGGLGGNGTNWVGGVGGIGYLSSITGTPTRYAGGGGGSVIYVDYYSQGGTGGLGGGGDGSTADGVDGTNGLGGGGGGAERLGGAKAGNGGSGIVIVSYPLGGNPYILDVTGNMNATKYYGDISGAFGSINNEFGEMNILNQDNADMNFKTNNQIRMTIKGDGKIGIGSFAPSYKFEVNDGTNTVTNGNFYNSTVGFGYIMKSPDGNCWQITVSDVGLLGASALTCP